jgi:hypothetical protein
MSLKTCIALVALACTGFAQANVPDRVEIRGLATTAAAAAQGEYELADGRRLAVQQRGTRLVAQIDGAPAVLLQPAATRWASADGRLSVEFHAAANGSVHRVTLKQAR